MSLGHLQPNYVQHNYVAMAVVALDRLLYNIVDMFKKAQTHKYSTKGNQSDARSVPTSAQFGTADATEPLGDT